MAGSVTVSGGDSGASGEDGGSVGGNAGGDSGGGEGGVSGHGRGGDSGGSETAGVGELTGTSLCLCLVIEYGVIFFRNFLFLSVNLPEPSTFTTYWS